jgi:hypothetical protein
VIITLNTKPLMQEVKTCTLTLHHLKRGHNIPIQYAVRYTHSLLEDTKLVRLLHTI